MAEKDSIRTFVPSSVAGQMTLVSSTINGRISPKDAERIERETVRRGRIHQRRLYYAGTQFDEENTKEATDCLPGERSDRVPEHRRLHAYSTQIQECVDFIANRLGAGFSIESSSPDVQQVIHEMIEATDPIYALDDSGDIEAVTDDVLREALIAGDTPTYVGWDPVEERPYLEFWEAESVEFLMRNRTEVAEVIRYDWVWDMVDGEEKQVEERVVYSRQPNDLGMLEVTAETYLGEESEPRFTEWLGIGSLPWRLLKADSKSLRGVRGESLITDQAMETADRYNAIEQTGYLIARYNSHSNVAVIGDAASLKLESDGRVSKDVADVLTFPGGTALQVLTLPTSPEMIEHQRDVLAQALHSVFGVQRSDPESIKGLGQLSGYALEILNQKTEGTFSRVARNWRKDWVALVELVLEITAWKRDAPYVLVHEETGDMREWTPPESMLDEAPEIPEGYRPYPMWWMVDPDTVFPNRKVSIRTGSGYIVDDVKVRDDYVAGLISREEALRKRGYDKPGIKRIMDEIEDEAERTRPEAPEVGLYGLPQQQPPAVGAPASPVQSGTAVTDTDRE